MQYDRGNFPLYSKGEIFLYTLESYKTINWSQVIIYCEVNEDFPDKDNYYSKINKIFPEAKIYTTRNAYQHQWQKALDELEKGGGTVDYKNYKITLPSELNYEGKPKTYLIDKGGEHVQAQSQAEVEQVVTEQVLFESFRSKQRRRKR